MRILSSALALRRAAAVCDNVCELRPPQPGLGLSLGRPSREVPCVAAQGTATGRGGCGAARSARP